MFIYLCLFGIFLPLTVYVLWCDERATHLRRLDVTGLLDTAYCATLFTIFMNGIIIIFTLEVSDMNTALQSILLLTTLPGFHVYSHINNIWVTTLCNQLMRYIIMEKRFVCWTLLPWSGSLRFVNMFHKLQTWRVHCLAQYVWIQ